MLRLISRVRVFGRRRLAPLHLLARNLPQDNRNRQWLDSPSSEHRMTASTSEHY